MKRGLDTLLCMFFLWQNEVSVVISSRAVNCANLLLFSFLCECISLLLWFFNWPTNTTYAFIYLRMWCIIKTYKSSILLCLHKLLSTCNNNCETKMLIIRIARLVLQKVTMAAPASSSTLTMDRGCSWQKRMSLSITNLLLFTQSVFMWYLLFAPQNPCKLATRAIVSSCSLHSVFATAKERQKSCCVN